MIMYFANSYKVTIVPVEVTKRTEYNVWLTDGSRNTINRCGTQYFDTWQEAQQWLREHMLQMIEYHENSIKNHTESLAHTRARLVELEAMKEPEQHV